MTFAPIIPWPLLVLALAAVLAFTALAFTRWNPLPRGRSQTPRSVRPAAFRCAAVVLLLLAMLRPGWPGGHAGTAAAEMDVFFVVDTSTSMAAEDYNGSDTRLAGARADVMAIAKELAGAKFSLITFDTKATVRMPLTRDATALQTAMTTLQPQNARYAKGSTVTGAAELLKERLAAAKEQHPGRPALVFYAGDGENTSAERPAAMDDANVAGGAVLGYGSAQGGRMKDTSDNDAGYLKDRSSGSAQDAVSRIDEEQLRTIANQLHVPYAHRTGTGPTSEMLGKAQPGAQTILDQDLPGRIELYWLLAFAAFLLALHEPLRHLTALRNLRTPARKEGSP
ncbi:Ca-activated chloride channel family protein [Paenarthrobacter nitroguajacolicus]|uniref:vWA domain-containing protein n=1 Tax=Paenarthrobacter TaxID=1742992 RepID=UPI002867803F|nr:VWA domain-containing protein [Paenarthrobacter nitroguajacolicus]MDR6987093.1 Ca-activated chloride channel family protein [Paenarthrobacter nitroguajacolicus]